MFTQKKISCHWHFKVVSSSFVLIPVSLNGSGRISRSSTDEELLTNGPFLNIYTTHEKYVRIIPDVMLLNFIDLLQSTRW